MSPAVLAEQLLNGLGIGFAYALIGLGYSLTFGALNIANLAYGEVFMSGAVAASFGAGALGLPPLVAVVIGIVAAMLVGLAIHLTAVAPMGRIEDPNSPRHVAVLVSTMGASVVLQYSALALFGPYPRPFPPLVPRVDTFVHGVAISSTLIVDLMTSMLTFAGLAFLLRRSRFGLRLRALTSNRDLGRAVGIAVGRDQTACVVVSSAIAGLAGVLVCEQIGAVSPFIGIPYGLKGLVALIVGRSLGGTALVAIGLGLAEALVAAYWSSSYRDLFVYALVLVFIVVRSYQGNQETQ